MTENPPAGGKVRLFAALDVPDEIRSGLAAWGSEELTDPALRRRFHGNPAVQPVLPRPGNRSKRHWLAAGGR